jgi:hypothetical protein
MKERNEFNLKNKFEYGFDANGGAYAGKEPIDEIKYNLVKLIHKNFQDFVFKISSKYTMNNFEKRLNTIRFFCDNGLINKINGLSYFNHYISYYIYNSCK